MNTDRTSVTIYSTWRGLLTAFVTPGILLGVGVLAVVVGGRLSVGAIVFFCLGAAAAAVGLFDLPRRCVADQNGIMRHCLLRKQPLAWDDIEIIARAPGPLLFGARDEESTLRSRPLGGLSAHIGRKRYLLVDHVESPEEFDDLVVVIRQNNGSIRIAASRPPEGTTPSWLYHRKHAGRDADEGPSRD